MYFYHTLQETMDARFEGEIDEVQDICNHGISCGFHGFIYNSELDTFWEHHGDEVEDYFFDLFGDTWLKDTGAADCTSVDAIKHHLIWAYVELWCSTKLDEALDEVVCA